jgi:hypothetical protein
MTEGHQRANTLDRNLHCAKSKYQQFRLNVPQKSYTSPRWGKNGVISSLNQNKPRCFFDKVRFIKTQQIASR